MAMMQDTGTLNCRSLI